MQLKLFKRLFTASKDTKKSVFKVINSHEKMGSEGEAKLANEIRMKQLQGYQREMAAARRVHAKFAKTIPTKAEIESSAKKERAERRAATWSKYVEGLKKTLNPPVKELQAAGKIPVRDDERRAAKAQRGQANLMAAMKSAVLMRRKYLNYLSTEVIPALITPSNLEAKIQEALQCEVPKSYSMGAEAVVEGENEVKRKLRGIRVPMEEYERRIEGDCEQVSEAQV